MNFIRKVRLVTTLGAAVAALSLGVIAPTASGAASSSSVLTYAEGAGASPNYIFPYSSCTYFSVDNMNQFQMEMYRPLYWFGLGTSPAVVDTPTTGAEAPNGLSLAAAPVMSNGDKTVTITMGNYKFADGQAVNGTSVQFFLNMYKSDPTAYCGYNAGYGIPDQVSSVTSTATTVTINFTTSVNANWILYNYLSEITPMPTAWSVTASGANSCATGTYGAAATNTACKAVVTYLQKNAMKTTNWTDKMWESGVDGPYALSAIDDLGNATLTANATYAGPVKPSIKTVKEVAFTSSTAEMNALRAGSIDLGYADPTYLTSSAPAPGEVGANWSAIASSYNLITGPTWSTSYAALNFNAKNPEAPELNQTYIRQALQQGINQAAIIAKIDKGYGLVNDSPLPANPPASLGTAPTDTNAYNLTSAEALLTSHGWKKVNGNLECASAGTAATDCGAGIKANQPLTIHFEYGSGQASMTDMVETILSAWNSLGIKTTQVAEPFNAVIGDCSSNSSNWSVCDWGAGWIFAPDYYPSGEWGFVPGASFNIGGYNDPHMTALVKATTFGTANLTAFAQYLEQQQPILFQPNGEATGEVAKTVKSSIGFGVNPLENFMPEYYSF